MSSNKDVVAIFWEGIRTRNWEACVEVLGADFKRIGMRHGGPDTISGRDNYKAFLEHVVPTFTQWYMEAKRITWAADGRSAVAECVETIQPTSAAEVLVMHELVEATIDDHGLIGRLDLYFKIPHPLPEWVVQANSNKGESGSA